MRSALFLCVLCAALLAACAAPGSTGVPGNGAGGRTPTPSVAPSEPGVRPGTVTGTFTLTETSSISRSGGTCSGNGVYSDFGPGMNVTIENELGGIIGTGTTESVDDGEDSPFCEVTFEITDLPESKLYVIGTEGRGNFSYSRADMEEMGWHVGVTFGPMGG